MTARKEDQVSIFFSDMLVSGTTRLPASNEFVQVMLDCFDWTLKVGTSRPGGFGIRGLAGYYLHDDSPLFTVPKFRSGSPN